MEQRELGKTGLKISTLGYGCASYWGMPYYSEKEATELVRYAVDQGVNFFDTGHSYSLGNAEPRLGRILKSLPSSVRNSLLISTKAGTKNGKYGSLYKDYSPSWIKQSIEQSLRQLGLENLPILHLHGPSLVQLTDELFYMLSDLKKQGLIKALSINSFDIPIIEATLNYPTVDCVMLDYNIMKQDREPLIDRLALAGKGIIGGGALANHAYVHPLKKMRGLRDCWYLLRAMKNHRKAIKKAEVFTWINNVEGFSPNQIALSFANANPKINCSVFGTTRMNHLKENIESLKVKLPPEIYARIRVSGVSK